jgi:hypothetical protein
MNRLRLAAAATLAIAVALAGVAAPAGAASVGFYGTYGAGDASGDLDTWEGNGWDWDRDTEHVGAGFALETPTGLYRFSYRLGIGWERIDAEGENGRPDSTLEGLVIDNDLTYDLFASPVSRFWIGPELRLGFFNGSLNEAGSGDRSFFAAGIGPVLGFDLALGPSAALSWKIGYLYTWYYGDNDSWDGDYYYHDYYYDDSEMDGGHGYVSMAVYFRLWGGPQAAPQPGTYQPGGRW